MEVERNIDHIILQHNELLSLIQNAFPKCMHIQDEKKKRCQILSG